MASHILRGLSAALVLGSLAQVVGSNVFAQVAAEFDGDVILGRPTDTSMSVSVMSYSDQYLYVEYGDQRGDFDARTVTMQLSPEAPHVFELTGLDPDTEYFYRVRFRQPEADVFRASAEHDFYTQRRRGSSFNFAVQADPHMGARTRFQEWCGDRCNRESANDVSFNTTVANMVARNPDFLVDLGDTFMTSQNHGNGLFEIQNRQRGAPIREAEVISDYVYLRNVLSRAASHMALFLVPGNHDTERQTRLDGTPNNLSVWANNARKTYYPTPTDNGFYTGSTSEFDFIGRHDGHYAWEWGDALFIGLDAFWYAPGGNSTPWDRTLGFEQYSWLRDTLQRSDATFKFVFLHHLIGGLDNSFGSSRGGHLYADYFEWGGRTPFDYENWSREDIVPFEASPRSRPEAGAPPMRTVDPLTEDYEFDRYRDDWGEPIHQMLVDNGVNIVFHGHDHMYVKEVHRDGIVYQETPTPAGTGEPGDVMLGAARMGYDTENGVIFSSSGFLNVSVSPDEVTVEYVKNIYDCDSDCGEIVDSYTIPAGR